MKKIRRVLAFMLTAALMAGASLPALAEDFGAESTYAQQEFVPEEPEVTVLSEDAQPESAEESAAAESTAAESTAECGTEESTADNTTESTAEETEPETVSVSETEPETVEAVSSGAAEDLKEETAEESTEEAFTEEESEEESMLEAGEEGLFLNAGNVSVTISGCVISGTKLQVTATSSASGTLYLYDLETYEDTSSFESREAIASVSVSANVPFTASADFKEGYLTDKFVFGVDGSGTSVSNAMYITNPEALAATSVLHTAGSKKGLLVYTTSAGVKEAAELGVKHSTVTVELTSLISSDGSLKKYGISSLKNQVSMLANSGIVVYLILVLPASANQLLRYPGSDGGPYYAAWNTGETGAAIYENLMKTLANELSGVVSHWIIGNEVNDNIQWNYMGPASITQHVQEYAKTFRLCYNIIRSVNASANVYIPVDHRWCQNANTTEKYDAKTYLDYFDRYVQSMGNIDWCLAFHAYSIPLSAPEVWDDGSAVYAYDGTLLAGGGEVTNSEQTYAISMKNIDVLTNYFCSKISRNTKGQVRTIGLTEQGWTSYSQRTNADAAKEQAASIAYAYYKAESNPYIECLIVSRQVDAQEMGNNYYKFGIENSAGSPKYSWEVFKNLGTADSLYTSAALPVITSGSGKCTGKLLYPTAVSAGWKSSYNTVVNGNDNVTLKNAASDDKVLSMKLNGYNASSTPYFGVSINIHSDEVETGKALLRVFSGEKILEIPVSKISTKRPQHLLFDLSGWAGISNITGVELWIRNISTADYMSVSELNCSASSEIDWSSIIDPNFTGLIEIDGEWYYFSSGAEDDTYVGLASYNGNWFYVKEGKIDWTYTGLTYYNKTWYYVENGMLKWDHTGLVPYNGNWYYVEKSVLNWNYTGLSQYDGIWYYVEKGVLNRKAVTLAYYNGNWYYVKNGVVNWDYTGLAQYNGGWYYVQNGSVNWKYTGLTQYYGTWYYVEKGYLNWNYTSLVYYNKIWYYVQKGVLNWNYTGLAKYNNGWYYVQKGSVNWNYTGLAQHNGGWYYVQNGSVNWKYTGLTLYYGTWYYVQNGFLDWSYTGPATNNGNTYYVINGKIDWTFSGTVTIDGKEYVVTNGCL